MDGLLALYIFMLAAFTGYEIIAKVPVILHTPLMSGSNFIHGVVVVGAMISGRPIPSSSRPSDSLPWRSARPMRRAVTW